MCPFVSGLFYLAQCIQGIMVVAHIKASLLLKAEWCLQTHTHAHTHTHTHTHTHHTTYHTHTHTPHTSYILAHTHTWHIHHTHTTTHTNTHTHTHTHSLFIHILLDTWGFSTSWLLWIMLQQNPGIQIPVLDSSGCTLKTQIAALTANDNSELCFLKDCQPVVHRGCSLYSYE